MRAEDRRKQLIDEVTYLREQLQAFVADFGDTDQEWDYLEESDECLVDIEDIIKTIII